MTNQEPMTNRQAINRIGTTLDEVSIMDIFGTLCNYKIAIHRNLAGTYSAIVVNTTEHYTTQVGDSSRIGLAKKIVDSFMIYEEVLDTKIGD